jgi:hypothetical protein
VKNRRSIRGTDKEYISSVKRQDSVSNQPTFLMGKTGFSSGNKMAGTELIICLHLLPRLKMIVAARHTCIEQIAKTLPSSISICCYEYFTSKD